MAAEDGKKTTTTTTDVRTYCVTLSDVQEAARRIAGSAHRTPVLTSRTLERELVPDNDEVRLFCKVEALQRTGSFKFRGALNATLAALGKDDSNNNDTAPIHLVTHSSGNHAQAVALAARLATERGGRAVRATIVMPENAPAVKRRAVLSYGAAVVDVASTNEAREERADALLASTPGSLFVHPSEDPRVVAGQGTVCLEMVEQVRELLSCVVRDDGPSSQSLDAVVIPVGGGGLAAGNTVALRGLLGDKVKIILAEPATLDDARRSRDAGVMLPHRPDNTLDSVADGLKTTLGPNTWPVVRDLVDDIFTVSEDAILRATRLVWERLKICIEPSAGVGVAVIGGWEFRDKYCKRGGEDYCRNIGVVLCGGNVDVVQVAALMGKLE